MKRFKNSQVTLHKNSICGWTVRWPSVENPGLFHEKHFEKVIGGGSSYLSATRFAKAKREEERRDNEELLVKIIV
tara:strand:+ start:1178 stop:1402 length:225 start_codon:yes stop_codon:yes gene_type:complete